MLFGTGVMNLSGTLMGVAFAIGIVWNAVIDPVAGNLSDRTISKRYGRRHGFILFGTFLLAAANIFLWCMPAALSNLAKFFWMLIGILIFQTCCTVISVPYNALAFDLTDDYDEQTELQGIKAVFFVFGLILPITVMASLETASNTAELSGRFNYLTYRNLAFIGSAIVIVCGLITFFGTRSHVLRLNEKARLINLNKEKISLKKIIKNFFEIFKDVNYRSIIIGICATSIASAFLTGIGMHVFTYTFGFEGFQMYLLIGELFVVIILSQPFWLYICQRTDKKPSLMNGLKLAALGIVLFTIVFIIRDSVSSNVLFAILTVPIVVVGLGMGSTYLIPQSMLSDVIAHNSKDDEVNKNATVTGFVNFANKIAQALTLLVIGLMLDAVGFDSSADSAVYKPGLNVKTGLGIVLLAGVTFGVILALVFTNKYKLKKEDIIKTKTKAESAVEKEKEEVNA